MLKLKLDFNKAISQQGTEKRYERRPDKAKFGEKAESIFINEYFEANFNAVWPSAIVFQHPVLEDEVFDEVYQLI